LAYYQAFFVSIPCAQPLEIAPIGDAVAATADGLVKNANGFLQPR
jgi:hypothetical protein